MTARRTDTPNMEQARWRLAKRFNTRRRDIPPAVREQEIGPRLGPAPSQWGRAMTDDCHSLRHLYGPMCPEMPIDLVT
jgi:hypothetical protein